MAKIHANKYFQRYIPYLLSPYQKTKEKKKKGKHAEPSGCRPGNSFIQQLVLFSSSHFFQFLFSFRLFLATLSSFRPFRRIFFFVAVPRTTSLTNINREFLATNIEYTRRDPVSSELRKYLFPNVFAFHDEFLALWSRGIKNSLTLKFIGSCFAKVLKKILKFMYFFAMRSLTEKNFFLKKMEILLHTFG